MANERHLQILLQGSSAWNDWRNENLLPHVDLTRAELAGCDLTDADLHGADLAKAKLQEAVLNRANLSGSRLEHADLSCAKLRAANLEKASSAWSILRGVDLENATLNEAHFHQADLTAALMKGTDLSSAELTGAILSDALLSGADLKNADLSKAKGLVQAQLAGTNLYHAILDDHIAEFKESLDRVAEVSKYTRKVFVTLFVLCVFSWLVISQATDEALVTNSAATPLPLIQATIPLASLFYFVPFFLTIIFLYFQMNLQELWRGLAGLPAVFPDGELLPRKAFPWIMTNLTYLYVARLVGRRPPYWLSNVVICIAGAWLAAPATVFSFWFRYLRVGDAWGTYWLSFLILAITWIAVDSYMETRKGFHEAGLTGNEFDSTRTRSLLKGRINHSLARAIRVVPALAVVGGCLGFYWQLPHLRGFFHETCYSFERPLGLRDTARQFCESRLTVDLRFADISKRMAGFDSNLAPQAGPPSVRPALLVGRDFSYGNLTRSLFLGSDLRQANFRKADLASADFSQTDVGGACFEEAMLMGTNLERASFGFTNLRRANIPRANFRRALFYKDDFTNANLYDSDFREAVLLQVDFSCVNLGKANLRNIRSTGGLKLHKASLKETNLSGADLSQTEGLTAE